MKREVSEALLDALDPWGARMLENMLTARSRAEYKRAAQYWRVYNRLQMRVPHSFDIRLTRTFKKHSASILENISKNNALFRMLTRNPPIPA